MIYVCFPNIALKQVARWSLLGLGLCLGYWACKEPPVQAPKPRSYPKVEYPQRHWKHFQSENCPFTFEYPDYMQVTKGKIIMQEEAPLHDCWFDLYGAKLNSRLHVSYLPISGENSLQKLHNDAFKLAYRHSVKASQIQEIPFKNEFGTSGFSFVLSGPVASSYMFYLTDEDEHFLRASLYFDTQARPDSLAPILEFVREDVDHFMNTFRWDSEG